MKKLVTRIFIVALVTINLIFIKDVYAIENKITIKSFNISTTELEEDGKIYFDLNYEGNASFVGIWAKEITTNKVFYISTQEISKKYFDLGKVFKDTSQNIGTYQLTGITFGLDSGTEYYSSTCDQSKPDCNYYDLSNSKFTIKAKPVEVTEEENPIYDYVLNMENVTVTVGEKVNAGFGSPSSVNGKKLNPKPLSSVMLVFTNKYDNTLLNVYLKSLEKNPYFIVPSTATPGLYKINYAYVTFTDGTSEKYYDKVGKVFSYGNEFTVIEKEVDRSKYVFGNEAYGPEIKEDLKKLDDNAIITIQANNVPLIDKGIFELIKGTNRTLMIEYGNTKWTFNGKDIVNPKSIEVCTEINEITKDIKKKIKTDAVMLKFTNNGDLPGKVLITINSKDLEEYINSEVIYIYYYNEEKNAFSKVAMEVQKNKNFYEFYINHNSKYIITKEELPEKILTDSTKFLKLNDKVEDKNTKIDIKTYLLLGIICTLVVILIIVVIAKTIKNRKRKKIIVNQQVQNEIEKTQNDINKN